MDVLPTSENAKYSMVMLVDDSSIDNFVNKKVIERYRFSDAVLTFTKARQALRYLLRLNQSGEAVPEILFLDLNMPEIDGFEFLETFNLLPAHIKKAIRVVILTSSINPTDVVTCNKYDFVITFLHKPLVKNNLDAVESLLTKNKEDIATTPTQSN